MESRGSGRSRWRQSAWVQIPALPLPGCATLDLASVSHPQSRNHHGTRHGCIWVFRCHSPGLALCPFLLAPLSQTPHSWRQDERHAPGCHPSSHPNRKRGLHSLRLQLKSQASLPLAEKMQGSDWSVLGHMPPHNGIGSTHSPWTEDQRRGVGASEEPTPDSPTGVHNGYKFELESALPVPLYYYVLLLTFRQSPLRTLGGGEETGPRLPKAGLTSPPPLPLSHLNLQERKSTRMIYTTL